MSIRRKHLVVSMSIFALLGIASAAWACTSQPRLMMVSPNRGRVAEAVEITGEGVAAENAITIRWNTLSGPKLAEVTPTGAGSFATTIVVPDVTPGVYSILVQTDNSVGRAAFEVTAEGSQSAAQSVSGSSNQAVRTDLWQGFSSLGDPLSGATAGKGSSLNQPWSALMGTGAAFAVAGLAGLTTLAEVAVRRRQRGSAETR